MKKKKVNKESSYKTVQLITKTREPQARFSTVKQAPVLRDINYKDFKKITEKVSFSLHEWSQILHLSERTLQRYSKANSNFPFPVVDRLLQIDKVIKRGIEVFGNADKFIGWLKSDPPMLEGRLSFNSLSSIEGVNMILTQLGRIEHGILA
jgi:putative toxin-antitoxin system antitoxin component (TIGR02293 family)